MAMVELRSSFQCLAGKLLGVFVKLFREFLKEDMNYEIVILVLQKSYDQ